MENKNSPSKSSQEAKGLDNGGSGHTQANEQAGGRKSMDGGIFDSGRGTRISRDGGAYQSPYNTRSSARK